MEDLLSFYVRIKIDNRKEIYTYQLRDIDFTVNQFLLNLVSILEKEKKTDLIKIIKDSINKNNIFCWKKACDKDAKFINLISKVEKVDGKEADIFQLEFLMD